MMNQFLTNLKYHKYNWTIHQFTLHVCYSLLLILVTVSNNVYAQVNFDVQNPHLTPYPSNLFTVPDANQITGRRVALPNSNCNSNTETCVFIKKLTTIANQLDGFNIQPRISIPFSKAIDINSIGSDTVFLVKLDNSDDNENCQFINTRWNCQNIVGINQIVWDVTSNTLSAESDQLLDQHTRYGLIVTNGVLEQDGNPVTINPFQNFIASLTGKNQLIKYKKALKLAIQEVTELTNLNENNIVSISVFTTQSVTSMMEKIRDKIKSSTPEPVDFNITSNGSRAVFNLNDITEQVYLEQVKTDATDISSFVPLFELISYQSSIGINNNIISQIAYGSFQSPDYREINYQLKTINMPIIATKTSEPIIQKYNKLYFTLILPYGNMPEAGWPVAIYGTGAGGSKDVEPYLIAANLAKKGIATIAINHAGHGGGPLSFLLVTLKNGDTNQVPAGGRNIDLNGDGIYGDIDKVGNDLYLGVKNIAQQSVVDIMQLVQIIKNGIDTNNNGEPDIDAEKISYLGVSLGGITSAMIMALDPDIHTGVITSVGGSYIEGSRLSPEPESPLFDPLKDENLPLRNEKPRINTISEAIASQEGYEILEWINQSGDALSYAPYILKHPLPGNLPKKVIVQFALGDRSVPNPVTTAMLRAGALVDRATLYRHDLVYNDPERYLLGDISNEINPHGFLMNFNNPALLDITQAAQHQVATFFASDGTITLDPDGLDGNIFTFLDNNWLPERCYYIPVDPGFKPCQ